PQGDLGPNGPIPKSRPFRVAGFFESGMLLFDSKLIYATLPDVQRFLGLEDVAGAIQIRVEDLEEARLVRDRLRVALAGRDLKITDWQARNRSLFSALKLEKIAMFLVLSINILLAAFSITSTLVMTIIERKREVAILMAMGSSHAAILRIFMSQGAFTGALGSLLGAIIGLSGGLALSRFGLPLNTEVYYISAIPIDVRVIDVLSIILVALLVSLLSTVYPALYASRLRPVEGLNKQ
ncbi:FtsX-like permease family protein, partial [Myxococcota bacterium]|nr:FtsX-like permease family protein [Myxococcota bacterium]